MSLADQIMAKSKENPDWGAGKLAKHFGCSREYVRTSARRLGFKFSIRRMTTWTPADDAELRRLRQVENMKWGEIGAILGRPLSSCQARFIDLTDPPVKTNIISDRVIVPADRFSDRDARVNIAHRDLTSAFFGDPKPGFSALERRA